MSTNVTLEQFITKVSELATATGVEIKKTRDKVGDTTSLATTNKSSTVAAINELATKVTAVENGAGASNLIDNTSGKGNKTYSSEKIESLINDKIVEAKSAVKADILNGADSAYDTLKEISDYIATDKTALASVLESVNNRLRFDIVQELTPEQKSNVVKALGLPEEFDFVATFKEALGEE